jgi:hypothetical protein
VLVGNFEKAQYALSAATNVLAIPTSVAYATGAQQRITPTRAAEIRQRIELTIATIRYVVSPGGISRFADDRWPVWNPASATYGWTTNIVHEKIEPWMTLRCRLKRK